MIAPARVRAALPGPRLTLRMRDQAIALHFVNGQPVTEEQKPDGEDGETWAMDVLFDRTGISFGDLRDVKFTLFAV